MCKNIAREMATKKSPESTRKKKSFFYPMNVQIFKNEVLMYV